MLLLIHSLFSSRPLVIHFTERGHYDRWDTSRAHVLPLPLRRPIHTAQGAICALLLLEGVQGRGMETRQPTVAFFPTQYETWPNKGFVTPHDKPLQTFKKKKNLSHNYALYPNQIKYDLQLVVRTDGFLTRFLVTNKQIAFGLLHCGKLYWIDLSPKGPRWILLGQFYWGVISVGSNLGLFCHVRKSFYGPFPASCAISIDLSGHVHSEMQPPVCCYWKDACAGRLLSLRYDIWLEPEQHIEEPKLDQVSLWRRQPCSTC